MVNRLYKICGVQPFLRDPSEKEFGGYVGFQEQENYWINKNLTV